MSLTQFFALLSRLLGRRPAGRGADKGIDRLAKSGGASARQAKDMRQAVKRARRAARLTRRTGR
ncbi:hypothetical protein [Paracoccus sp. S3-43]|uniref:hypothetical protein n=1 Tax=Paracoccus sp. S3-43 TaxID=3030011 RepID=UPI0023B11C09|nr:hypothetical protein [Paracoccus sp. S3-43]WEF24239.1 hypothetical protein PXD02_15890 [Paracoccus sp. S3-43]